MNESVDSEEVVCCVERSARIFEDREPAMELTISGVASVRVKATRQPIYSGIYFLFAGLKLAKFTRMEKVWFRGCTTTSMVIGATLRLPGSSGGS